MKIKLLFPASLFLLLMFVLILGGCPSPLSGDLSTNHTSEPTIIVDPARGLAVLTEPDGSETVISSLEGDQLVGCVSVTDYVTYDTGDTSRHMGGSTGPRAIVLGTRTDGRPGVWIVFPGGIVIVPEGDGSDPTSELLEAVSEADGFRWDDGWDYEARALSDDGMIIVGTAENPDATWLADYLGTTPRVAVWWNLYKKADGRYFISHARVIADYPEWDFDDVKSGRHGHGHHWGFYRWLQWFFDRLGLWFFVWADDYMGDLATAEDLGDAALIETFGDGTYGIYGYDKEGDFARAVIEPWKVLSIEKTDPPGGGVVVNLPPWPVTGPIGPHFLYTGTGEDMWFELAVTNDDGQIVTNPGPFDPDSGDIVTFTATLVEITYKEVDGIQVLPDFRVESNGVFHITDNTNLAGLSAQFTVTSSDGEFMTPYGSIQPIIVLFF